MIHIKIKNKSYGELNIFNNTELILHEGEFIAIKGPSGSGKTTLINMIGMLDQDYEGTYMIDGRSLNNKHINQYRKSFSYMFQTPFLIPYLNVYENITMPLVNKGLKVIESNVDKILNELNILDKKYSSVEILSGGEKTRVSLARAIISEGKILVVDEPTGNLDPTHAEIVIKSISRLKKLYNLTVIMVTHSNDFDHYYDRIIKIEHGKLVDVN